jgi:hypothetical protein
VPAVKAHFQVWPLAEELLVLVLPLHHFTAVSVHIEYFWRGLFMLFVPLLQTICHWLEDTVLLRRHKDTVQHLTMFVANAGDPQGSPLLCT